MSKFDGIYLEMEDGTRLEGTMIESKEKEEKSGFQIPEKASYELEIDFDQPKCFLDYQRYLQYHLLGYDIYSVPFFKKKMNEINE